MQSLWKIAVAVIAAFGLCWNTAALAQENTPAVPVEWWDCNFVDGKDMEDLQKVNAKFNKWADKNMADYSAWIMMPNLHSGVDYDFGWLGSWSSGASFGKGVDAFMQANDMQDAFAEVIDCSSRHVMATSAVVNAPDGPPDNGVVIFAACSHREGKTFDDSYNAHKKMSEVMRGMGGKGASWIFYPGLGTAEDLDYWQVIAFKNYAELGETTEMWTNGGGWKKGAEILGPVTSCESSSVWNAYLVRGGNR